MKILILSNRFFSIYNSRQKIIKSLLQEGNKVVILADFDGFEKDIQTLDNTGALNCINFSFSASFRFLGNIYFLKKKIKEENPDIVHAYNPIPIYSAAFLKSFFNYKLAITVTGLGGAYGHNSKAVLIYDQLYKFSIKRADKVVFQNKDDYEYFLNKLPVEHFEKIEVITSSGVDLARFAQKDLSNNYKEKDAFKILFISRLIKQKGIKYLEEIAKLLQEDTQIEIHIFGEYLPNHKDSISKEDCDRLLALKNVFFYGFVKNIQQKYIEHDLLVCCSLREGVPRVILEASATGIPVVAFDVTGVREGVEDNINGFLIDAFDVDAFVKKIKELKSNFALYAKISESSRRYIEEKFSQKIILKNYENIYKDFKKYKHD